MVPGNISIQFYYLFEADEKLYLPIFKGIIPPGVDPGYNILHIKYFMELQRDTTVSLLNEDAHY